MLTRFIFIVGLLSTLFQTGFAQETPRIAQYMFNKQLYNPAAYGTELSEFNASILYRHQFANVPGAPRLASAWGDYKLTGKKMAVGANINTYKIGISNQKEVLLNYAYGVQLNRKFKLSMGLRGGISNISVNINELENVWDEDDQAIADLYYKSTFAKIGAGLHVYSKGFYFGLSAPELYSGNKTFYAESTKKPYIVYTGGTVILSDNYILKPSAIAYIAESSRVDLSILLEVKQYFWTGGTITTQNQFMLTAGAYLGPRIRFGYAYEFSKSGTAPRLNTHELNLRYSVDNLFK
jgi:type IX secretion system PorP/SprF family membrane protein